MHPEVFRHEISGQLKSAFKNWPKGIVCLFLERDGTDLARCCHLVNLGVRHTGVHCTVPLAFLWVYNFSNKDQIFKVVLLSLIFFPSEARHFVGLQLSAYLCFSSFLVNFANVYSQEITRVFKLRTMDIGKSIYMEGGRSYGQPAQRWFQFLLDFSSHCLTSHMEASRLTTETVMSNIDNGTCQIRHKSTSTSKMLLIMILSKYQEKQHPISLTIRILMHTLVLTSLASTGLPLSCIQKNRILKASAIQIGPRPVMLLGCLAKQRPNTQQGKISSNVRCFPKYARHLERLVLIMSFSSL